MRKLLFLAVSAVLICGCGGRAKKAAENTGTATEETTAVNDGHNAKNSLDYQGTYIGVITTGEGEINIKLTLLDNTYTREVTRPESPETVKKSAGSFEWVVGDEIMLDGLELPDRFFVAENRLIVLDEEGNKIEGETSGKYVLIKQD